YMSPEQIEGRPLDFRTDQFSFGALVYEMLAGRRAFARRSSIETMAAIVAEEPPAIARICSDAPPAIVDVVDRCLAKAPEHRYDSTAQLARDLRAARDYAGGARGRQGMHAWKLAAGIVAALIVVAAVLIGWPRIRGLSSASSSAPREVVVLPFASGTSEEGATLFA